MKYHFASWLAFSIAGAFAIASGCTYTPPEVNNAGGQGGAGQGGNASSSSGVAGEGGNGGMGTGGGAEGGAAGSGGQGGSGGGGICVDGATRECYVGPPKVGGVGECDKGQETCSEGQWLDCKGSVWPTLEACSTNVDSNCDGMLGCKGTPIDAADQGAALDDATLAIACGQGIDGADGVVFATGLQLAAAWSKDNQSSGKVLLFARNPDGTIADWSGKFTQLDSAFAYGTGVAIDANSNVIVGGVYGNGNLSINGTALEDSAVKRGFLARFGPTGDLALAKHFGAGGMVEVRSVAVGKTGTAYVSGDYTGSPTFGTYVLPPSDGRDGFIAAISPDGTIPWAKAFSGTLDQSVSELAVDEGGLLFAAIRFAGNLFVPNSMSGSDMQFGSLGAGDIALLRVDTANGGAIWVERISGMGDAYVGGLAAYKSDLFIVGGFRGDVLAGGFTDSSMDPAPAWDAFTFRYGLDGKYVSHYITKSAGSQEPYGVAIDSFNDPIVAGEFSGTFVPGNNEPTISAGANNDVNAFTLKLNTNLLARWAKGLGGTGLPQKATSVCIGSTTGHVFIGGGFQGQLTGIPNAPQALNTEGYNAFLARISN